MSSIDFSRSLCESYCVDTPNVQLAGFFYGVAGAVALWTVSNIASKCLGIAIADRRLTVSSPIFHRRPLSYREICCLSHWESKSALVLTVLMIGIAVLLHVLVQVKDPACMADCAAYEHYGFRDS